MDHDFGGPDHCLAGTCRGAMGRSTRAAGDCPEMAYLDPRGDVGIALFRQASFVLSRLWIGAVGHWDGHLGRRSSLYNGMLDDVAESGKVGRISGLGSGMGYLGGIIALLVIYIAWIKPKVVGLE